ncbi:MAG TPA: hypothetical protein VN612_08205 [Acidobacteriaceae bacterium]|nr:hypothetical protein [Acidobacteriaceae bacterium]
MTLVGEYYAKQLLRRHREVEKYLQDKDKLRKRALIEIEISLSENIEALNTFPGIPEPVITFSKSKFGFVLHGQQTGRNVFLLIQNSCCLGSLTEAMSSIEAIEEEDGELDYTSLEYTNYGGAKRELYSERIAIRTIAGRN